MTLARLTTFTIIFVCSLSAAALQTGEFDAHLNETRIHYAVQGKGPPLMILPNSWGLSHHGLRALFEPLERHFTLIYFDPRGMGRSAPVEKDEDYSMATVRADMDALRRTLGLGKVPVLGWSNGGINLLHFAARYPDSVAAAVVVHAAARFTPEDQQRIARERPEVVKAFTAYRSLSSSAASDDERERNHRRFVMDSWFPLLFADPERGRTLLATMYADTGLSFRHMQYSNGPDAAERDATGELSRIHCPVLLIAGRHDLVAPERVREVHEAIPGSRFVVFEKSGHFAPVEEPGKFRRVVSRFLEDLSR